APVLGEVGLQLLPVAGDVLRRAGGAGDPSFGPEDALLHRLDETGQVGRARIGELRPTPDPDLGTLGKARLDLDVFDLIEAAVVGDGLAFESGDDDVEDLVGAG